MNINIIAEIAHIEPTENYSTDRIAEVAGRYDHYTNDHLVNIEEEYNMEIARLEFELETARVRSQIAKAVLNSRSVIVLK